MIGKVGLTILAAVTLWGLWFMMWMLVLLFGQGAWVLVVIIGGILVLPLTCIIFEDTVAMWRDDGAT